MEQSSFYIYTCSGLMIYIYLPIFHSLTSYYFWSITIQASFGAALVGILAHIVCLPNHLYCRAATAPKGNATIIQNSITTVRAVWVYAVFSPHCTPNVGAHNCEIDCPYTNDHKQGNFPDNQCKKQHQKYNPKGYDPPECLLVQCSTGCSTPKEIQFQPHHDLCQYNGCTKESIAPQAIFTHFATLAQWFPPSSIDVAVSCYLM
jgi:hypothetical protein